MSLGKNAFGNGFDLGSTMQNLKEKPYIQKYGGTSVGSVEKIKKIAERVVRQSRTHKSIAVVVSAMSGETNRLVELVKQVHPNLKTRNYDMAVAAGEQVSVALMAAAIEAEGGRARPFLAYQLGIKTDDRHGQARIQSIDTGKLQACWDAGEVAVIAGFQGVTDDLEITTLGRGGSDTSAVALAVAVGAAVCEINTDVNGVYTADPRYVKNARKIPLMDFEVALEMASLGSKVLHNRCVELAAKYKTPIVVRSTFESDEQEGTRIMSFTDKERLEAPVVSGVTLDRQVIKVSIDHLPATVSALDQVFQAVADRGINVDVIIHNKVVGKDTASLGFTVSDQDKAQTLSVLEALQQTKELANISYKVRENLSKVSVVGLGMISHPGVASRVFTTLGKAEVEILMISTSEIKVSCVIPSEEADHAAVVLHKEFVERED